MGFSFRVGFGFARGRSAAFGRAARRWVVFVLSLFLALPVRAVPSDLWGENGERWTSSGRLPDFSFAGYRSSAVPIPALPVTANVRDFGARGNGRADDTAAFERALESIREGAVFIPAGRYKITRRIQINRNRVVLRGEGRDISVLVFPVPLSKAVPQDSKPGRKEALNYWSWSGGHLSFEGTNEGKRLAAVTAPAARGERTLRVSSTAPFWKGRNVRLLLTDTDGSLGRHLHAERADASADLKGRVLVDFSATVVSVGRGEIELNRSLRVDARPAWKPSLYADLPSTEDVGAENLTIEFPGKPYAGHHLEPGYNAVEFAGVSNGWVRNVFIRNPDSAVILRSASKFCTIENVTIDADPKRERDGAWGHHGFLAADRSQDNLFTGFRVEKRFLHDLAVSGMAAGNVFSRGVGVNMSFDHHRKAPFENLFTEINVGAGANVWVSGGDAEAGPHSGARETFWNIRSASPLSGPSWGIQANVVGMVFDRNAFGGTGGIDPWIEPIDPIDLDPANLFEAQVERRREGGGKADRPR